MTPQENALILTMEAVGMAEIQHVMLDEALIRFEMYRHLHGPMRYTPDGPITLDRALVSQFIGLKAIHAKHMTKAEFNRHLSDLIREKAKLVVFNPLA